MPSILIDTNILIDHLRGKPAATEFLKSKLHDGTDIYCSVITHLELFSGVRQKEEDAVRSLLDMFHAAIVDMSIAATAGRYMSLYMKSHSLTPADAILAATARILGAALFTLNRKHYPMTDIGVVMPY